MTPAIAGSVAPVWMWSSPGGVGHGPRVWYSGIGAQGRGPGNGGAVGTAGLGSGTFCGLGYASVGLGGAGGPGGSFVGPCVGSAGAL